MASSSHKFTLLGVFVTVLVLVVTPGCELVGSTSGGGSDLTRNQKAWNSFNRGTYDFVLQRGCFCVYAGQFEIRVRDNQIEEIIPSWDDLRGVPKEDYQYFQTIDDIFDLLENAYTEEAFLIDVEYSDNGYPTQISIDYIENAVDDELSLGVSDLLMEVD